MSRRAFTEKVGGGACMHTFLTTKVLNNANALFPSFRSLPRVQHNILFFLTEASRRQCTRPRFLLLVMPAWFPLHQACSLFITGRGGHSEETQMYQRHRYPSELTIGEFKICPRLLVSWTRMGAKSCSETGRRGKRYARNSDSAPMRNSSDLLGSRSWPDPDDRERQTCHEVKVAPLLC